jgi:hypothetical protein
MCCLRFEDRTYEDLRSTLPGKGARVATEEGEGEVVAQDPVKQVVTVELAEKKQITVPVAEIKVLSAAPEPEKDASEDEPVETEQQDTRQNEQA